MSQGAIGLVFGRRQGRKKYAPHRQPQPGCVVIDNTRTSVERSATFRGWCRKCESARHRNTRIGHHRQSELFDHTDDGGAQADQGSPSVLRGTNVATSRLYPVLARKAIE